MSTPTILDCGHVLPEEYTRAGHVGGTGYGIDRDGRKLCYPCCAERDRADMIATGRATLYLVDSQASTGRAWTVQNWPGSLCFPTSRVKQSTGFGFGGSYPVVHAWFVGPDGFVWIARNAGDNQIARCKRTKQRAR